MHHSELGLGSCLGPIGSARMATGFRNLTLGPPIGDGTLRAASTLSTVHGFGVKGSLRRAAVARTRIGSPHAHPQPHTRLRFPTPRGPERVCD